MAFTVIETGTISDGDLPVDRLAAQMRLADGVADDPEQAKRLRLRLRAAIDLIERRIGRVLLSRSVTLGGRSTGQRRIELPIAPVSAVTAMSLHRAGGDVAHTLPRIEAAADRPVAILAQPIRAEEYIVMTVTAGVDAWDLVPHGLSQAVLLLAEALDAGDREILTPMVRSLLRPFERMRIGGTTR